jgi:predicted nucleic acid-binding Zn ribbon protein
MAGHLYRCSYCADETTVDHPVGTAPPKALTHDSGCAVCGGPRRRVIAWGGATQLKGSGWAGRRDRGRS